MQPEHTQSHKFKQEIISNILNRCSFSKGAFSIKNMKDKKQILPKMRGFIIETMS